MILTFTHINKKMKFLFVEAFYNKEVKLNEEALKLLSKYKTIGLFAAVQFVKLDEVKKQLKEKGMKVLSSKAKRTSTENQILGCDCFSDSFDNELFEKVDALLYIGDGMFHPKALLLAQKDLKKEKPVIIFDPLSGSAKFLTKRDIEKQVKRYQVNVLKYLHAKNVGVLVSTKTGQQYLNYALLLKERAKASSLDKSFYIFVGDTLEMREMENFPFIDAWVNTACPRIGTDDIMNFPQAMININDALKLTSNNFNEEFKIVG